MKNLYKERISELASSKQRKKTMDAETQDVKRPYMAPKEKKARKEESASYNPPPSSVREQYIEDAPEEYSRGGSMKRGKGKVKRAGGGKVASRGVALRGFGKEVR